MGVEACRRNCHFGVASAVFLQIFQRRGACDAGDRATVTSISHDDIAIVKFASPLSKDVPIYPVNETAFDESVTATSMGYGRWGTGVSGYTTGASYTGKRLGKNLIDYYFLDDEGSGVRETFEFDFDPPNSADSLDKLPRTGGLWCSN